MQAGLATWPALFVSSRYGSDSGEEGGAELADGVDEAVAGEVRGGAVAPGDRDGIDAAIGSGAHVSRGIPHHHSITARHPRSGEHFPDNLRRGFQGEAVAIAKDGAELHAGEELPDEALRARLELVRRHRQAHSPALKFSEQLRDPRVRAGADVDIGRIEGLEIGEAGVYKSFVRLQRLGKGTGDEIAHPVTHHTAVFLHGVEREAAEPEGVVNRCSEILNGVYKGAVQVEKNQFFHIFAKILLFARNVFRYTHTRVFHPHP